MNLRSLWGILPVLLFLLPAAVCAQSGRVSVDGYVRDELTQEPVTAARVELRTVSGDPVGQAVVSGNGGEFHLVAMATGSYSILVERSGYQSASVPIGNLVQSNVVVSLHPADAGKSSAAPGSISLHELSVPAKARAAFEKGVALLIKSDPDNARAFAQFQRAIKESPAYYEAYGERSIAQFRMGDAQGAEESLRKSVELSGNHYAKALALLAELLNSQNRFSEAESAARLAIAADESSARSHCQLARALSGMKRPSEAEAAAKRALELEPANPLISLVLGNVHLQEHDLAAAVRDFDSYLSRAPLGPQSDLVRRSRDQALRVLDAQHERARIQTP